MQNRLRSFRRLQRSLFSAAVLLGAYGRGNSDTARGRDPAQSLPVVHANDNRAAAGVRRGDTLFLRLEFRMARWFPGADTGASVVAPVLAEEGKAPQVPAPLIRVPRGTTVVVTVSNTLHDSTAIVRGLVPHPGRLSDSTLVRPGASATLRFAAGQAGTYVYGVWPGNIDYAKHEREEAVGAFVVDSSDAPPTDRVFVLNIWGEKKDSVSYPNALAINGKTWPFTERITATTGDTLAWRVVNGSNRPHPMHLHGFYFWLDAGGNGAGDTAVARDGRHLRVTQEMDTFSTIAMRWVASRPGNWLFHCHLGFHVIPGAADLGGAIDNRGALSGDATQHMSGLILGINVRRAATWVEPARTRPRRLRVMVDETPGRGRAPATMGYVLQRGGLPARDSVEVPGTLLTLVRGEPTDITVVNRMRVPTAVHWHGVELESRSDGVPGWSGAGAIVAPMIAPGDSFVARLTLPRAGTFIYHTHLGDLVQLTSGLYAPLVVLPSGATFDPSTDHVFLASWDGTNDPPHPLLNGDSLPPPVTWARGRAQRLRFINIGVAGSVTFTLLRDSLPEQWRRLAQDGADLPRAQATIGPAQLVDAIGQTHDVLFTPRARGPYRLLLGDPKKPDVVQRIVVR